MAKVKEVSSYSGSAWGTAVPIGANATNVDMATNPTDYDSSTSETSTTLIGTNDVKIISSDTDLTAWGKFNRFRKRVANAIADLSLIAIQSTTPTKGEKLWLDTSGSGLMIPQVNDSIASATDTWSSNKIGNQINAIENGLAIIVEGDICTTAVPAGGYAYIKNNTHGLAEGLYRNKTTSAFPTTGGTADSTVFEYVGAGGLNALNDNFTTNTFTVTRQNTTTSGSHFKGVYTAKNCIIICDFTPNATASGWVTIAKSNYVAAQSIYGIVSDVTEIGKSIVIRIGINGDISAYKPTGDHNYLGQIIFQ